MTPRCLGNGDVIADRNAVMCGGRCRGSISLWLSACVVYHLGRIPKYELLFGGLDFLFPGIIRLACYYYQG